MDNNAANNMPDPPANIPDWSFYAHLHACTTDFGRCDASKFQFRLARRTLLAQLSLMARTHCQACGGRAHRARDCPTNSRLGMLGAVSLEYAKLIAYARGRVAVADRDRIGPL